MNRRTWLGSALASAATLLGGRSVASVVDDPLQPYRHLGVNQWMFLPKSEIDWLDQATVLVNKAWHRKQQVTVSQTALGEILVVPAALIAYDESENDE